MLLNYTPQYINKAILIPLPEKEHHEGHVMIYVSIQGVRYHTHMIRQNNAEISGSVSN